MNVNFKKIITLTCREFNDYYVKIQISGIE